MVQRSVTVVLKLRERGAKSACRWCCRSENYKSFWEAAGGQKVIYDRPIFNEFSVQIPPDSKANANYLVHSKYSGTLKRVLFSYQLAPAVIAYVPDLMAGDAVEPFINADKRVGTVFLQFDSVEQRDAMLEEIEDHILVELE